MDHKGQGSIPKETIPSLKKSSLAPLKNDPSFLFYIPTTWIHRFPGA